MADQNMQHRLIVITNFAHGGYWRAGKAFGQGENTFKADHFNDTQLAQLKDDPRLKVSFGDGAEVSQTPTPPQEAGLLGDDLLAVSFGDAIAKLEPDNKAHFTSGGKPQCDALSELMGKAISASERDALWTEHKAQTSEDDQ